MAGEVADQNRRDADHHARIHPVIEVTGPADDILGDAGEAIRVGLREEGLLGKDVGRAGAGIELRKLGVGDRRGKAQEQGDDDPEPDGAAGHRRSVLRLLDKGQPQERPRRDQRHRIHGQSGEPQGFLHLGRLRIGSHQNTSFFVAVDLAEGALIGESPRRRHDNLETRPANFVPAISSLRGGIVAKWLEAIGYIGNEIVNCRLCEFRECYIVIGIQSDEYAHYISTSDTVNIYESASCRRSRAATRDTPGPLNHFLLM